MAKRIIVSAICVPLIFLIFYGLPPVCVPIAASILSMVAVHEVLWSTGFVKNLWISGLSIILAGLIPFWVYTGEEMHTALVGIFVYFFLVFVVAISSHYTVTMEKMGGPFFFAVLIPYFLSSFVRLNAMEMGGQNVGKYFIIIPMVCAFLSDACAYFTGLSLGRHKLAPELSPKKTVEGSAGGFVGAILACMLYGWIIQTFFHLNVNYFYLALYGALGSAVSQIGDLSFSYIKRQYGLKDFGNVFPGHGGVLDRFDSVIFSAPLLELLITWLPAITF